MNDWLYLAAAIAAETLATSLLKSSEGFTRLGPSLIVVAGYGCTFFFLSLTLRTIPVGVAYAIWSGVGIILVTLIAWLIFGQKNRSARSDWYRADRGGRYCAEAVFQNKRVLTVLPFNTSPEQDPDCAINTRLQLIARVASFPPQYELHVC